MVDGANQSDLIIFDTNDRLRFSIAATVDRSQLPAAFRVELMHRCYYFKYKSSVDSIFTTLPTLSSKIFKM